MYLYDPAAPPWRQGHIGFMFLELLWLGKLHTQGWEAWLQAGLREDSYTGVGSLAAGRFKGGFIYRGGKPGCMQV